MTNLSHPYRRVGHRKGFPQRWMLLTGNILQLPRSHLYPVHLSRLLDYNTVSYSTSLQVYSPAILIRSSMPQGSLLGPLSHLTFCCGWILCRFSWRISLDVFECGWSVLRCFLNNPGIKTKLITEIHVFIT